ncbi:cytochrome c3 family protein [candidate division KSB1 bacterium]|nr:cytochrome c3 family protein [candidate division KSB1 bacterium]
MTTALFGIKSGSKVPRFRIFLTALSFILSAAMMPATFAADDEECLTCHADPTLIVEKNGKEYSLFVREAVLKGTVHEGNGCVSCHTDADVDDFPHDSPLQKVDCGQCHDDLAQRYAKSLHGVALARENPDAPSCTDCHGKHTILDSKNPKSPSYVMNIPATCGQCHSEDSPVAKRQRLTHTDALRNYTESIHGEGLFQGGLIVTAVCTSCHTSHDVLRHTDPASSIHRDNIAATCMQCHAQIERVHQRVIKGELWEKQPHIIPACVDCHSPHKIRRVFYTEEFQDSYCLQCHQNKDLTRAHADGTIDSLYVNVSLLEHSAHNQNIACVKCHPNVSRRKQPVCKDAGPVDCSTCHLQQAEDTDQGIHGQLLKKNDPNAPLCTDCHGDHDILRKTDLNAPIFTRNIPMLCAKCHREGEKAAIRYTGDETRVVAHYTQSIHGKGLMESGLMVSAVCTNCHTAHKPLPASDPNSTVHPTRVGWTCGICHLGIYESFKSSIHSPLVNKSDEKLPTCNSCHKSHEINRVDRTDFRAQILQQCGGCHEYVTKTYFETYHGKVSKLGSAIAAKCSDCHGSHNILPVTYTASTLNRQNIIATCKKCHPNSNRKFTGYLTHATHHNRVKYPILFYTFWSMTFLVIGVFTFFGIHTLLWIPRSLRERIKLKQKLPAKPKKYMVRFTLFPRILHIMVIVSFFGLAFTGMSLKFAGYEWAAAVIRFVGGVEMAGLIHRLCAIITFLYFGLHFVYMYQNAKKEQISFYKYIFSKEGMLPGKRDFIEFYQTVKWFLGKGEQPQYGKWTYWEKFDYFAVFWGIAIIGSTGLILWFPEFFTRFLPGYWINVATIIHSDEALLATGFIFTIHFFNTHFRPQKFPMDPVIFSGKVPYEEWKHERPREYDILVKDGKLKAHLDKKPPPKWLITWSRIFGTFFLILGFGFVVLIIWAMIFLYK